METNPVFAASVPDLCSLRLINHRGRRKIRKEHEDILTVDFVILTITLIT